MYVRAHTGGKKARAPLSNVCKHNRDNDKTELHPQTVIIQSYILVRSVKLRTRSIKLEIALPFSWEFLLTSDWAVKLHLSTVGHRAWVHAVRKNEKVVTWLRPSRICTHIRLCSFLKRTSELVCLLAQSTVLPVRRCSYNHLWFYRKRWNFSGINGHTSSEWSLLTFWHQPCSKNMFYCNITLWNVPGVCVLFPVCT